MKQTVDITFRNVDINLKEDKSKLTISFELDGSYEVGILKSYQ